MSNLSVNTITDALGGSTASINGLTPQASNMQPHNLIINGAMTVAQRATTHATSVTNGYHTVDRFKMGGNGTVGQWTSSQDTDVPAGFSKSFKLECTTADTSLASDDHIGIEYIPEGYSMDSVSKGTPEAKPMTLSFYMKASVLKTMVVEMTDASLSRHVNYSVIPSATNTWERIVINIPADTSGSFNQGTNSKAGELNFWLAAGSSYNSGTTQATWTARTAANIMVGVSNWADTVGNTIWITGVQLEAGSTASSFAHENVGDTLRKCQRYYLQYEGFVAGTYSGNSASTSVNFPVQMRASPTVSASNPINISQPGVQDHVQSSANATIYGGNRVTQNGCAVNMANFSSLTSTIPYVHNINFNGVNPNALIFSAELS